MYSQATAPQSIGGVLDSGFRLFRESFTKVIALTVATSLVSGIPAVLAQNYLTATGGVPTPPPASVWPLLVLVWLALIAFGLFFMGAIVARVDGVANGSPVSIRDALWHGLRCLPSLLGATFVFAVIMIVAAILLVIPALIVWVWLIFYTCAAVIERQGPIQSLVYSRRITRGNWWRITGLLTVVFIIAMVAYFVVITVIGVFAVSSPQVLVPGQLPWIQLVVGPIMSALFMPLYYAMQLAIYYDLRLRYEGGDLAARIAANA